MYHVRIGYADGTHATLKYLSGQEAEEAYKYWVERMNSDLFGIEYVGFTHIVNTPY